MPVLHSRMNGLAGAGGRRYISDGCGLGGVYNEAQVRRTRQFVGEGEHRVAFAIKAEIRDLRSQMFDFTAQKTMYGGKQIAAGDAVFVFASENEGGRGLVARGVVASAIAIAKKPGIARQTPRVSLCIRRTALAKRPLGRSELRSLTDWHDGQPGTELNFKLYRQATNKIVGISDAAAAFLDEFF